MPRLIYFLVKSVCPVICPAVKKVPVPFVVWYQTGQQEFETTYEHEWMVEFDVVGGCRFQILRNKFGLVDGYVIHFGDG